jgi:hypothetical protein
MNLRHYKGFFKKTSIFRLVDDIFSGVNHFGGPQRLSMSARRRNFPQCSSCMGLHSLSSLPQIKLNMSALSRVLPSHQLLAGSTDSGAFCAHCF